MRDLGWTLEELDGELWARGIDPETVSGDDIARVLDYPRVELAADEITERKEKE